MRNYIIILALSLVSNWVYSQGHTLRKEDLTTGKHLSKGEFSIDLSGDWICSQCANNIKIHITEDTKHFVQPPIDVYYDRINIKVTKFIYDGKDISKQFKDTIELINPYARYILGQYHDPTTGNLMKLEITEANTNQFILIVKKPEVDIVKNNRGFIFPEKIVFVRY